MEQHQIGAVRAYRLSDRPVVEASSVPGYEPIFNAGLLVHQGVYHLFARGVRSGYRRNDGEGPRFLDYVSDVLVFESEDGLAYEFKYVLAHAGLGGTYAIEDPRVQRVRSNGDEHVVMTYTNLMATDGDAPWRIGMHELVYEAGRFCLVDAPPRVIGPPGVPNKDGVVFNLADGKLALLHRVYPNIQIAVFDSIQRMAAADGRYWRHHLKDIDRHTIITPSAGALAAGAGAPPVATDEGHVLFFHERREDGTYTMNVALLDSATGRVRRRLDDPLLAPELSWERVGDADNVVFVQGAYKRDGSIYLTYGAGDRCVGAAAVDEAQLLEALMASG